MINNFKLYFKMFRSKGFYLPYKYFVENHLFDLKRNINTHSLVEKKQFNKKIENLDNGVHYACSWESTIVLSLKIAISEISSNLNNFSFYDIGCGKGKVVIVWKEFLLKNNLNNSIFGLDYSSELTEIAKQNYFKIFNQHGNFIHSDVSNVNFKKNKYYLFYLYNPFDEKILSIFLRKIKFCNFLLIYNVPLHHNLFLKDKKINLVYQKIGKHLNENFNIYKNY